MTTKSKRWSSKNEGKILVSLFESGIADPRKQAPTEIDAIKELKEEFNELSTNSFRSNYRKTANDWIAGKAIEGTRKKNLQQSLNEEQVEESHNEEVLVEEEFEEENMILPSITPTVTHATKASTMGGQKFKPNETKFYPRFTSHIYPAKNYWREQIIIETPGSFDGTKGTYEAGIDEENNQFVFKIPPNDVFNDPHTIHAYQAAKFGRKFGDDSAKTQAFKESTKAGRKNWSTFRHNLQFKGTKSNDLGSVPWIDFAIIDYDGRKTPILIVELKSVEPIEKEVVPETHDLTANTFVSPLKMTGVDFANGSTAQEALFLQEMIKRGLKMSDITNFANKRNNDDINDDMFDGEDPENGRDPKHVKSTEHSWLFNKSK